MKSKILKLVSILLSLFLLVWCVPFSHAGAPFDPVEGDPNSTTPTIDIEDPDKLPAEEEFPDAEAVENREETTEEFIAEEEEPPLSDSVSLDNLEDQAFYDALIAAGEDEEAEAFLQSLEENSEVPVEEFSDFNEDPFLESQTSETTEDGGAEELEHEELQAETDDPEVTNDEETIEMTSLEEEEEIVQDMTEENSEQGSSEETMMNEETTESEAEVIEDPLAEESAESEELDREALQLELEQQLKDENPGMTDEEATQQAEEIIQSTFGGATTNEEPPVEESEDNFDMEAFEADLHNPEFGLLHDEIQGILDFFNSGGEEGELSKKQWGVLETMFGVETETENVEDTETISTEEENTTHNEEVQRTNENTENETTQITSTESSENPESETNLEELLSQLGETSDDYETPFASEAGAADAAASDLGGGGSTGGGSLPDSSSYGGARLSSMGPMANYSQWGSAVIPISLANRIATLRKMFDLIKTGRIDLLVQFYKDIYALVALIKSQGLLVPEEVMAMIYDAQNYQITQRVQVETENPEADLKKAKAIPEEAEQPVKSVVQIKEPPKEPPVEVFSEDDFEVSDKIEAAVNLAQRNMIVPHVANPHLTVTPAVAPVFSNNNNSGQTN